MFGFTYYNEVGPICKPDVPRFPRFLGFALYHLNEMARTASDELWEVSPQPLPAITREPGQSLLLLTSPAAAFFLTFTFNSTDVTLSSGLYLCHVEHFQIPLPTPPPKRSLTQGYCASHGLTKSWGNRKGDLQHSMVKGNS